MSAVLRGIAGQHSGRQSVECLDDASPGNKTGDYISRQPSAEIFRREGGKIDRIGRIDDDAPVPGRGVANGLWPASEWNGQDDDIGLEPFLDRRGLDVLAEPADKIGQRRRSTAVGDQNIDVVAGELSGERGADGAGADDCVSHDAFPFCWAEWRNEALVAPTMGASVGIPPPGKSGRREEERIRARPAR